MCLISFTHSPMLEITELKLKKSSCLILVLNLEITVISKRENKRFFKAMIYVYLAPTPLTFVSPGEHKLCSACASGNPQLTSDEASLA